MSEGPLRPQELARIALEVASEAGALLAKGWRTRPTAESKQSLVDLVTEWDLESERLIRERLAERAPGVPVVAEEHGGSRGSGPTFYCDPLDGTTNYVHGHPFWAVSIGVLDGATPVAGAVVAPSLGTTWVGWGAQAERSGERCRVSSTTALGDALLATGFPPDRSQEPDNNFPAFTRVKRRCRGVRRCGSAAIDLCLVADGTYDGYWERRLHAWDVAAGAAIVLGAGGTLTALDGGPAKLEVGHLVASNGQIHQALLELAGDPPG